MKTAQLGTVLLLSALFTSAVSSPPAAHAQTYYLRSMGAPLPFDPYDGAEPIVTLDASRQIYEVEDNTNDYEMLTTAKELDAMSTSGMMSADSIDPNGGTNGSGGGTYTNNFQSYVYGSNDLWLQVTQTDMISQYAYLVLHGTISGEFYQLLSTNQLNSGAWTLGDFAPGAFGTNQTEFTAYFGTNSQMFYRAHEANAVVAIQFGGQNAIEPNPSMGDPGQNGTVQLYSEYSLTNNLVVYYQISGTAQSGVDYAPLSGSVTLSPDNTSTNISIVPLFDSQVDGIETVTLTLQQTNSYLIDAANSSATVTIADSSIVLYVYPTGSGEAIKANGPPGEPAVAGQFQFHRQDDVRGLYPAMTVYYSVSGSATNGEDYAFLSGSITFTNTQHDAYLNISPLADPELDGIQTVTVTLIPTNTYLVSADNSNATVNINDSSTTVGIQWVQDAIETNAATGVGQPGIFQVHRSDDRGDYPPMTVNYTISGTASNGVDYQTLSGMVTFADTAQDTNIFINTIEQDLIESNETVVLTLVPNSNAYYIDTNNPSASLIIQTTIGFLTVATNLNGPIGIEYYQPSNSLIISYNEAANGNPFNFARIYTNGGVTVLTNWSGVSGVADEVYLAAIKTGGALTNSAGFTNGDLFFGSGTGIGWLSADGTRSNLNWCILTNSVATNALLLRGGICLDQTGTFSNHLIAVTSFGNDLTDPKGVWSIDAHAHPTLLTNLNTEHLEGVTILTNDVQKWGPWAGKIIAGDDLHTDTNNVPEPLIYTISTNAIVTPYNTMALISGGIYPESFAVIPANQTLYFSAFDSGKVMELPSVYLTNHVGDLLIVQDGEVAQTALFIVHWNAQGSNFVTSQIPLPGSIAHIEDAKFAPIQLPGN